MEVAGGPGAVAAAAGAGLVGAAAGVGGAAAAGGVGAARRWSTATGQSHHSQDHGRHRTVLEMLAYVPFCLFCEKNARQFLLQFERRC
jgi:hypothetical protein